MSLIKPRVGSTSISGLSDVDFSTSPANDNVLTYQSGKWVPRTPPSSGTPSSGETYIVELSRWSISSNGTNAIATTKGINDAFAWAKLNNFGVVILPKGSYLIDKDSSVKILSDTHYKFYGCTFIEESNSYTGYETITLDSVQNVTVEGGKIKGDRESHNYALAGSHEWGYGLHVTQACYNILIKNMDSYEFTGDGFAVSSNFDNLGGMQHPGHFAKGDIAADGTIDVTKTTYTTVSKFFPIAGAVNPGYIFYAGDGYGGYGAGMNLNKVPIKVHFYGSTQNYLGFRKTRTYEFIYLDSMPTGTTQIRFSYLQNFDLLNGNLHYVLCAKMPQFVTFKGCKSYKNRRQGSSVMGGRFITYEDCEFFDIGNPMPNSNGASPGFGIDVEDGYQMNHKITVRNCNFHDNRSGSFTCVSTRGVYLENNKFSGYVRLGGSGDDYLSFNNMYYGDTNGGSITSGVEADGTFCTFRNDHIFGYNFSGYCANTLLENCVFSKGSIATGGETLKIYNCKFTFDDVDAQPAILFGNKTLDVRNTLFDMRSGPAFSSGYAEEAIWSNVKVLMKDTSGGKMLYAKNLVVENCQFLNVGTTVANYSSMVAQESMRVEGCTFKNLSFRFDGDGLLGTGINDKTALDSGYTSHVFKNNKIIWDSSYTANVPVTFEARGAGVGFTYIPRLEVTQNTIMVTGQGNSFGILNSLRVYAENYLNLSDNTIITTNAAGISTTGQISVDWAYRTNASISPRPKTFMVAQNNKALGNSTILYTANLNTQLEKNIVGSAPIYQSFASSLPASGFFQLAEEIKNSNPVAGGNLGWVCVTSGYADTNTWTASTLYPAMSRVLSGGKIYEAQNTGKSTATAPVFPASGSVDDKVGATTWTASGLRTVGQFVLPTVVNGYYYECTTAGTSGAAEPQWSTTANTAMPSTADNGVVWTPRQIIRWKQVGIPAVFRQYGTIQP